MPFLSAPLVSGLIVLAAASDAPPRWDIAAICTRLVGSDERAETRQGCRQEQEQALSEARDKWSSFPGDLRTRCTETAGLDNRPSYVELIECINLGVLAARNRGGGEGSLRLDERQPQPPSGAQAPSGAQPPGATQRP